MYQLSDYYYHLPPEKIAQDPCSERSASKLFVVNRQENRFSHALFSDLTDILRPDDLLVVNNTRVIKARLFGKKTTGGKVEILILDYTSGLKNLNTKGCFECECLIRASKRPKPGSVILLPDHAQAMVISHDDRISIVRFLHQDFLSFINKNGHLPLPPYITRDYEQANPDDNNNYQTVYASEEGAVAAPTAGLHFTESLIADLERQGIQFAPITLHVGYGTFVPVRVDDIRDHQIHSEFFTISKKSADKINKAKSSGRRVIAVGTTSVRTLEYLADDQGFIRSETGVCDLYIYPGYTFKCVDAMITNFHLPESTLLMLVSAFYSREKMLAAYQEAIERDYRFFSYGDAMFIE